MPCVSLYGIRWCSAGISRISDALVLPMAQGHVEKDKMEVVKPLGLGFNGWPGDAAFLSLETMEGLATALSSTRQFWC
jgi:hypothetical protein